MCAYLVELERLRDGERLVRDPDRLVVLVRQHPETRGHREDACLRRRRLRLGHELECTGHMAVGLVAAPPVPRTLRQQRLGLPGRLAIAPFEQRVPSFDQRLVTSYRCGEMEGPCSPEEELGVVGIVRRGQREGRREVLRGG
jgi:hypothetical protein